MNAIAVGSIRTDALGTILNDKVEKMMVDMTPMARLGEVEDIAACALYLASPAASFVTGEIYGCNGGPRARSTSRCRAPTSDSFDFRITFPRAALDEA